MLDSSRRGARWPIGVLVVAVPVALAVALWDRPAGAPPSSLPGARTASESASEAARARQDGGDDPPKPSPGPAGVPLEQTPVPPLAGNLNDVAASERVAASPRLEVAAVSTADLCGRLLTSATDGGNASEAAVLLTELRKRRPRPSLRPDLTAALFARGQRDAAAETVSYWEDADLQSFVMDASRSRGVESTHLESLVSHVVATLRERNGDLRPAWDALGSHAEPRIRKAGVLALAGVRPPDIGKLLEVLRTDPADDVRVYIAASLAALAAAGELTPDQSFAAVECMLADASPAVRAWGARAALSSAPELSPAIIETICDPVAARSSYASDVFLAVALRAGLEARVSERWTRHDRDASLSGAIEHLARVDAAFAAGYLRRTLPAALGEWGASSHELEALLETSVGLGLGDQVLRVAASSNVPWRNRLAALRVAVRRGVDSAAEAVIGVVSAPGEDPLLRLELILPGSDVTLSGGAQVRFCDALRQVAEGDPDRWLRSAARTALAAPER